MPFNTNIAIICGVSLAAFIFLGIFILIFAKMIKGSRVKKRKNGPDQEALLIQEIYQGLTRMEQRVDALETILFYQKKEKSQDDN
jgi:phage shock protein B